MKRVFTILVAGWLLSACGMIGWWNSPVNPMGTRAGGWFGYGNFSSNGERIYFTATNDRSQRIPYRGGPNFGGMMMGMGNNNLACASCHGPDGRGGLHRMHMQVMDAPDIRYVALSSEEEAEEHGGDEGHEHAGGGYDLDDFRLAVIDGQHPNGEPLSWEMPRWRMTDEDLADLFDYLKSLDG